MFGELTAQQFLERHWQKSPLLLPAALPGFRSPLSADELAGLACEPEVESRLVLGSRETSWQLEHGPFEEERLRSLPPRDWTLLVQDVDKWLPELAPLLEPFRCIPDWRIDDIMVSFAAPGGSVGPHTDQYDVFLLQAQGRRRWQLSEHFDPALEPGIDLKILQHFSAEREIVVEPGDLLYLPPGVAHFGVALDECMTFSIGFRAPDQRELLLALAQELLERARPTRFGDPGRSVAEDPGLIGATDLKALRELVRAGLALDDRELDRFLGRYLTRGKPNLEAEPRPNAARNVKKRLARGGQLIKRWGARFGYVLEDDGVCLFADGHERQLARSELDWIVPLTRGIPFGAAQLERHPDALPELLALLGYGALDWHEPGRS
ncbi:MAG TPA: cupin domain-containing protein [Polyangiaceae bacterium]|nr:cupin domain-containing protein [Polyangiaceae bacterium]